MLLLNSHLDPKKLEAHEQADDALSCVRRLVPEFQFLQLTDKLLAYCQKSTDEIFLTFNEKDKQKN